MGNNQDVFAIVYFNLSQSTQNALELSAYELLSLATSSLSPTSFMSSISCGMTVLAFLKNKKSRNLFNSSLNGVMNAANTKATTIATNRHTLLATIRSEKSYGKLNRRTKTAFYFAANDSFCTFAAK